MKTLQNVLGAGILGMALSSCEPVEKPRNFSDEYRPKITQAVEKKEESFSSLEGKIVKVQSSHLPYTWESGYRGFGSSHPFEYVMVEDREGKVHTLIYPYSKAILERSAAVKYRPLELGVINVNTFIDQYINAEFFTDNNFFLEAEGIIMKNGIQYQQNVQEKGK